jgi:excisionase family DNA binding protein
MATSIAGDSAPIPDIPQDRLLTTAEVCRILSIRRLRLYEILRRGEMKSVRVGRHHRFLPSTVARYIRHQMGEV